MRGLLPQAGRRPLFGTNPIAFGWPREEKIPRLSSTWPPVRRRGERSNSINGREKRCRKGGGLTVTVRPATDAQAILDGAMLTFGGHKGSALAAMVELLAGPLIGDMTSAESLAWDKGAGGLPYGGELILALDPARFLGTGGSAASGTCRETLCRYAAARGAFAGRTSLSFPYAYNS